MVSKYKITGFGDSITLATRQEENDKWLNIMGKGLRSRFPETEFDIINSGVGGNTSREGLARIDTDVIAHQPDLVLIEFGGNDITYIPERHVEPEEFGENLSEMLDQIEAGTEADVIMLTFPPIINSRHQYGEMDFFTSRGGMEKYCNIYRKIMREFAATNDLPLIDIHAALTRESQLHGDEKYTLPDGIHLTTEGNKLVAKEVLESVCQHIKALFATTDI